MAPSAVEVVTNTSMLPKNGIDVLPSKLATLDLLPTHESVSPTLPSVSSLPTVIDGVALETASRILNIIHRYRLRRSPGEPERSDEGTLKFLSLIYNHVKAGRTVPMCLPAFPFKSANDLQKVLGALPDRAEELALANLNSLCAAVKAVYPPGALLTIISDGLVYNDLLGVPDRDVWNYGQTLRAMAVDQGLEHITFSRLRDLVAIDLPETLDEMTYSANATNFRRALVNTFGRPDWNWETFSQNEDVTLTYRGYLKFLETDLATVYPITESRTKTQFRKGLKYIAREMMARGDAFASAVRQKYPDHVRLSIHPSTGAVKLSICPLPTDSFYTTPWHCTVAYQVDGTVQTGMRADFRDDDRFELIYENGRPSYFREKSDLFSWGEENGGIEVTPIFPTGWMIKPAKGSGALSIKLVNAEKVRALAEVCSPIVLRGFSKSTHRDLYVDKAEEFGTPLPWKFGLVLEVKDQGDNTAGLNNVLSSEWMPFHYDGLFKTSKQLDADGNEVTVSTPPRFQFFAGVTESPKDTGFTIFSSSTSIFHKLPKWLSVEYLSTLTWSVATSSFDATTLNGIPLVIAHPVTGKPCLRYHEPWPASKTKFDATCVTIDGVSEDESTRICAVLDELLHDRRVAYYHAWDKGDLVISDNILMMHTRSDFHSGSPRELWRIHFD